MSRRRRRGFPIGEVILLALLLAAAKQWTWLAVLLFITAVGFLPGVLRGIFGPRPRWDGYSEPTYGPDPSSWPTAQPQPTTDTAFGWDYTPKRYFFTKSEAAFFHGVKGVIPSDHHVFPKVRLSDLLDIKATGREFWSSFGRVSQKHVDFILCDGSFHPYLAIEIDGWSHQEPRQRVSDQTKDRAMNVAGLPIVRYQVGTDWDFDRVAGYVPR